MAGRVDHRGFIQLKASATKPLVHSGGGRELAEAATEALTNARPWASGKIQFSSRGIKFPVGNEAWRQLSAIGTIKRPIQDLVSTEIAWFSIKIISIQ